MLNVTSDYLQATKSANRKSYISGTLETANNSYALNDSVFIKETFKVTNQCVSGATIEFGAVYAGECSFALKVDIDRYTLFDAKIQLSHFLEMSDGSYAEIPLGVYWVDSATRVGKKIKLTALDNMTKFDIAVSEITNGTLYELLAFMCEKCGVEMAQTQQQIEALHANTTDIAYTISNERISTYRDALSALCAMICAFATIDRQGRLVICQYPTVSTDSNDRNSRFNSCEFSDYVTKYSAVTARFVAEENYYPYIAKDKDSDGLVLDIGDIPVVGGTPDVKNQLLQNVLDTLKIISYVPSVLYIPPNPAYELGDMISCKNVNGGNATLNTFVMYFSLDYRQKETIRCYGENPRLQNVKSKTSKQISSVEAAGRAVATVYATNPADIQIKQSAKQVLSLNYVTAEDCKPISWFCIEFELDVDGIVEFSLLHGLVPITDGVFTQYYTAGRHIASFFYVDSVDTNTRISLICMAKCYADVNSKTRVQDAKIISFENALASLAYVESLTDVSSISVKEVAPDDTEPTMQITALFARGVIYSQGSGGQSAPWDGQLEFMESISKVYALGEVSIGEINANINITQEAPPTSGFAESIGIIEAFGEVSIGAISVNVGESVVIKDFTLTTSNAPDDAEYSNFVSTAYTAFALRTEYEYTSMAQEIDSGLMCAIDINTDDFINIQNLEVE